MSGPVSHAIRAVEREHDPNRRAAIIGALALTALASPALGASPSSLAQACDWAIRHYAWINDPGDDDESWPDGRLDGELARYDAVVTRAIEEPSRSLADMQAKARMVLAELDADPPTDDREVLMQTILREVVAMGGAA